MRIVLISTYELGRQPFGLASPAALLRREGHEVTLLDLSRAPLLVEAVARAELIGFYLPMHTATRLAAPLIGQIRKLNPSAHLCGYGLYATINAGRLRELGLKTLIAGEFEAELVELARALPRPGLPPVVSMKRIPFAAPSREGLPPLDQYATLEIGGERRVTGYTEASRGCKHRCRHCPVVPVYDGKFRIVAEEVVLADVRQQVAAGARHVTFGDPDFFNGPTHARRVVESLHREFPEVTYDITVKVEHLLKEAALLPVLRDTGCLFITTAVESVDDRVLALLDKGHTRRDFIEAVAQCRRHGLVLAPTFIPFTPWTTREGYRELLRLLVELDLVDHVAPVQLVLRLLITAESRLLELGDIQEVLGPFDPAGLVWRWEHEDPAVDSLALRLLHLVDQEQKQGHSRREIFAHIWEAAHEDAPPLPHDFHLLPRAAIPYLNEPWYC